MRVCVTNYKQFARQTESEPNEFIVNYIVYNKMLHCNTARVRTNDFCTHHYMVPQECTHYGYIHVANRAMFYSIVF